MLKSFIIAHGNCSSSVHTSISNASTLVYYSLDDILSISNASFCGHGVFCYKLNITLS